MSSLRARSELPTLPRWRLQPPAHPSLRRAHALRHLKSVGLAGVIALALGALAANANTAANPAPGTSTPTADALTPAQRQVALAFAQELAQQALQAMPSATRAQATLGDLDARLRLAPCRHVQAHLPAGSPPMGRVRIGLRCTEGDTPWNVHLPATVQVFGPGLVASRTLSVGSTLNAADLKSAEVDLAADRAAALTEPTALVGRETQRALAAGEPLRQSHLKARVWFAAGETVKVVARGPGFQVVSAGQALNPGVEGQAARVRTDNGRILTGTATAERVVELPL
jgi:flagella basal body P-ring formation protein FlgA